MLNIWTPCYFDIRNDNNNVETMNKDMNKYGQGQMKAGIRIVIYEVILWVVWRSRGWSWVFIFNSDLHCHKPNMMAVRTELYRLIITLNTSNSSAIHLLSSFSSDMSSSLDSRIETGLQFLIRVASICWYLTVTQNLNLGVKYMSDRCILHL